MNQSKLKEIAVVESVVKYCFVFKGIQWRRKGQYNGELNILPHLCVTPLINCISSYYLLLTQNAGKRQMHEKLTLKRKLLYGQNRKFVIKC